LTGRMAGRGSKSRVLVTWRVLVAMPSTEASGETTGALHNMSETVGALGNMPATEAVGEDTDGGRGVDDTGVAMLLRNWSMRAIFLPRPSVSTTRSSHIGRAVEARCETQRVYIPLDRTSMTALDVSQRDTHLPLDQ